MALATIIYAKNAIKSHLIEFDYWLDPSSREIMEFACKQVEYSEEFAGRVYSKSMVTNVNKAAFKLKGAVTKFLRRHIEFESGNRAEGIKKLEKAINLFSERMKKLEKENSDELYSLPMPEGEEDEEDAAAGSTMVGLSDQYTQLKDRLTVVKFLPGATQLQVVKVKGMPGIGKTTLARKIFDDRDVVQHFDCRVWVRVGRECESKDIRRRILDQLLLREEGADLNERLKGKRYLIVLDDIWDRYMRPFWEDHFPNEFNGSRLLLVSRLQLADDFITPEIPRAWAIQMRLMNKEESWHLLREKLEFVDDELEELGRKIAEKCDGLPLTIVTVAKLLSEADRTVQCWNEIATRKNHQLFKAAYEQISKVLLPSYQRLPRTLQICFMFMALFPQNYEIPRSKLINLWDADGFPDQDLHESTNLDAMGCLVELDSNSMVMIYKTTLTGVYGRPRIIKTCGLHSSLWYLSNREAARTKFSLVLDILSDVSGEGIKRQPRLSFHNNILFGIKGVNKSVEESCASTAHSVLCYAPYLPYQVPLCFGLRLLRELDALSIRFYEFPLEVLELVELRYLALTSNGNLPPTISKLSNLQFLIVGSHLSIIKLYSSSSSSYLPMEIWNMKELQHLQVAGNDLPDPCGASQQLHRLLKLSGVSPKSCTEEVFRAVPNLEKLRIQVELSPDSGREPLSCLAHISCFSRLTSLKCVVVNPNMAVPHFAPLSSFPSSLARLTLSGLGYAWEEMSSIASLQYLQVLKLLNYAFRGPEWEIRKGDFPSLTFLVIEDTDLVKWKIGDGGLPMLHCLIVRCCYKLREIDGYFGGTIRKEIEMVDCNPLGADQMKMKCRWYDIEPTLYVRVSCSFYNEKPKA